MNWEAIGAIAELLGAIAVILSLLYLTTQVRQANKLARGQTRQRMVEQAQHEVYQGMVIDPSIMRSLYKTEPLCEDEWIRLSGWLLAAMRQREYEWFQYKDGNIDEELWIAYRGVMKIHLGSARTRKWWETNGSFPFDKEFCEMVRQQLNDSGGQDYFMSFQKLISDSDPGPGYEAPTNKAMEPDA
ncbi:MAG: hypothetical protein V7754_23320 [Halioglobus sp.]